MLPPEVNSLRMMCGAGSAPMLQAAAAWSSLADELGSAADSFGAVTTGLTSQAWQGPAAAAMTEAAAPYRAFLRAASTRALTASTGAKAVAEVFEACKSAMVHPEVISANRRAMVQAVRTNFFGFNAPFIAAAEAAYEEFWATDVAAMVGYHGGASAVAAQLSSWQQTLKSLPGIGQLLGGAGGVAPAAPGDPNFGIGNKDGGLNFGNGNTGNNNFGNGNTGDSNVGGGNTGNNNIGSGNRGFGVGGTGRGNWGFGNLGNDNIGMGNRGNPATSSNPGANFGLGNFGNGNFGLGNHGDLNVGAGNTGNGNVGFGLTGNKLVGVGGAYYDSATGAFHFDNPFANGNIGFGNSGTGNIGFFNSGDGNVGIFNSGFHAPADPEFGNIQGIGIGNSGFGNIGIGNTGTGDFGIGNVGQLNTGIGNAGSFNTGFGNSGSLNTGWNNSGSTNTFDGNSGNTNTGFWNSGNLNTGFGATTDSTATHSGFGNTGNFGSSGFFNTASGGVTNGNMSGLFNTASGGTGNDGRISGFFNTGVTGALPPLFPVSGVVSGFNSGFLNRGTGVAGLFSITQLLKNL
ncbi:hypothetical protein A9W98_07935 [Mycobacterium gordonae]|uniref:PPE domain-containing protein n=1 Tax=Mycobacterium gordonae TaxID=1778 RepID=A0A1A6BNH2_MYCGO|nr:PPE family protein [Mycobacterium gordonae]OBS03846.1 hypothetical protein A9W98_07935 [Mycobacterium gordonae]